MGLFDYLTCHYPLPDVDFNYVFKEPFQTKSFDPSMEHYTLTIDGRIIHHKVRYETVPVEERPLFGTSKWDSSPLAQFIGACRSVPIGDEYLDLTDTIRFYHSVGAEWFEFTATFVDGKLVDLRRVYHSYT